MDLIFFIFFPLRDMLRPSLIVEFKPDNPDLLATASFDGTIKVWDINTLTAVYTSPGNEGVIYSISWAPGKNILIKV